AAACARHHVPLTVRGGGTGNYGQAVPLAGGVVLDMGGLDRTLHVAPGIGRFEAGARLLDIDRALRERDDLPGRWELRFHPSTRKHATIGGFVAGGAAGCGSCSWGQISDLGAVRAVEVVTLEEAPRVIALAGEDVRTVLHAYGVNGIITAVELPLAPWQPWAERVVAFPSLGAAARFGHALGAAEGIAKKEIAVFDGRIAPFLKRLAPHVPPGSAFVITMVAEPQADALATLSATHGGTFVYDRGWEEAEAAAFDGAGAMPPLYEYCWNHTTLHALRIEPDITYLQVRFPAGEEVALVESLEAALGDELLLHLEVQRRFGRVFVSGLPLLRFRSPERMAEIVEMIEAGGGAVSNPHSYLLDDAGWKRTDAPQAAFKAEADPHGLMNPGKLKSSAAS
ncbi:MAG: FAD-binding oxidoreductase, partial [Rhizobiales bacterium]|nr:FAD-binding oxidoreductase [Hyphomicrobiales bacterium]